jgi:hypothetical protein
MPIIQRIAPVFLYTHQLPVIAEPGLGKLKFAPNGQFDSFMEQYDRLFFHGDDVAYLRNRTNDRCAVQSAGDIMRRPNGTNDHARSWR